MFIVCLDKLEQDRPLTGLDPTERRVRIPLALRSPASGEGTTWERMND